MKFIRPKKIPKAILQAEVYHYCRNNDICCCLDYQLPNSDMNMVIIKDGEIVLLVEFMDGYSCINKEYIDKSQRKYDMFPVPTIVCNNWSDIKTTCNYIHDTIFGNIQK